MRTTAPWLVVFAIAVSGAMLTGAGLADAWGSPPPQTDIAQDELQESSDNVNPEKEIQGPVSSGDSDLVGLIVDGIKKLPQIAGAVILLPVTLMQLGFPAWFALPLGSLAYIIAAIGIIEVASNREWT